MDKYYLVQTRGDLTRDFFTYSKSGLNKGQAVLVESDWGQELGWVNKECEKQP